jgi:enamine deaminase RidA (YjgF/YER057c/UK114 family)
MSLETRIIALAGAIGADVKDLYLKQGSLASLTTTAQDSIVNAINELDAAIAAAGVQIDDLATDGATTVTWSADKIFDEIAAAKVAVTNSLTDGAAAALDTLNELATALDNDPAFATTVAASLANRVRVDAAQAFTAPEQAQARANIDAASATDLTTLTIAVGDTDHDFVADYTAAKA